MKTYVIQNGAKLKKIIVTYSSIIFVYKNYRKETVLRDALVRAIQEKITDNEIDKDLLDAITQNFSDVLQGALWVFPDEVQKIKFICFEDPVFTGQRSNVLKEKTPHEKVEPNVSTQIKTSGNKKHLYHKIAPFICRFTKENQNILLTISSKIFPPEQWTISSKIMNDFFNCKNLPDLMNLLKTMKGGNVMADNMQLVIDSINWEETHYENQEKMVINASLKEGSMLENAQSINIEGANFTFFKASKDISSQTEYTTFLTGNEIELILSHKIDPFTCHFTKDNEGICLTLSPDIYEEELRISKQNKRDILRCKNLPDLINTLKAIKGGNIMADNIQLLIDSGHWEKMYYKNQKKTAIQALVMESSMPENAQNILIKSDSCAFFHTSQDTSLQTEYLTTGNEIDLILSHTIDPYTCHFTRDNEDTWLTLSSDIYEEELRISKQNKRDILRCKNIPDLINVLETIKNGHYMVNNIKQLIESTEMSVTEYNHQIR